MRKDATILTEISRLVGLSISWISRLLRNTNPESGKKMDVRKRGRKPVDGLDNLFLLEVMNYDLTGINRTGGQMFSKSKLNVFINPHTVAFGYPPDRGQLLHRWFSSVYVLWTGPSIGISFSLFI